MPGKKECNIPLEFRMKGKKALKILLIGDAPMALNEGGINQTLYNVFSFIKPENFMGVSFFSEEYLQKLGSTGPYISRYKRFKYNGIKLPNVKFARNLNPFVEWINYSIAQCTNNKHNENLVEEIKAFNPDVIVPCINSTIGILMYHKLFKHNKFEGTIVPYFMDDWMNNNTFKWLNGSIQDTIKEMLQKNQYWIMIGKELSEILMVRYQTSPQRVLYIRNPVDLSTAPEPKQYVKNKVFTIAYAGALWPMHYDGFLAFAKAVNLISTQENQIKIVAYTQDYHWNHRKADLEPLGVQYGGHLPYSKIHESLNKADALLITSSFQKQNYNHSKASLQTKITDYCLSRSLIISVGPVYSANNNFIKENECGVCIESNDEKLISLKLKEIIENIDDYPKYVTNAFESLKDFTKEKTQSKLSDFLFEVSEMRTAHL
jgi:glycosyltransferase involved in cell wall biosynthesis